MAASKKQIWMKMNHEPNKKKNDEHVESAQYSMMRTQTQNEEFGEFMLNAVVYDGSNENDNMKEEEQKMVEVGGLRTSGVAGRIRIWMWGVKWCCVAEEKKHRKLHET